MNHLLDSNVASESMKRMSDAAVLAWVDAQPPESLFLSAVSIGRAQVEDWIDLGMLELFRDRILPVTQRIADKWGRLDAPVSYTHLTLPTNREV
mgnify:CR=1 FL=1